MEKFNNLKTYEEYRSFHVATGWETEQGEENVARSQGRGAKKDPNEPFFNKDKKEYFKGKAREFTDGRTKQYQEIYDRQGTELTDGIQNMIEIGEMVTEENIGKIKSNKHGDVKILLKDGIRLAVDGRSYSYIGINIGLDNEKYFNVLYERFGGYDIKRSDETERLSGEWNAILRKTAKKIMKVVDTKEIVF